MWVSLCFRPIQKTSSLRQRAAAVHIINNQKKNKTPLKSSRAGRKGLLRFLQSFSIKAAPDGQGNSRIKASTNGPVSKGQG
jgi:hypothetical protein